MSAPHSRSAEQNLLGSLLADESQWERLVPPPEESHFHGSDHRVIFKAMRNLRTLSTSVDVITVSEYLERGNDLEGAGGLAYLSMLVRETLAPKNAPEYADIVRSDAARRCLVELGESLVSSTEAPDETLARAEAVLNTIRQLRGSKLTSGRQIERCSLSAVAIGDFLSLQIPPRKHLLAPVLPEQGLMMIHGPRGLGKTHLTVGICVAVASGGKFLRWSAPEAGGVLLVDGEMPASALQERLAKAVQASEEEIRAPLRIVTPDLNRDAEMPDLSTPAGQAAIDALVGDAKLIVLDNLSSLMRGVENDAESWQPLQTWALRHRAQGRSIVFIHHSGKGGAQRGTSRREDVLDTVIGLRRPSDYSQTQGARFEVHIEKGRSLYGEDAESFEAQLTADPHGLQAWTMKSLEDGQDNRINELASLGMKPAEIAADLGVHKATVYRHLKKVNGHA
jgi:hypothetical protein